MRNTILIAIISLLAAGCKKEGAGSKPKLEYKSVNTRVLDIGQIIEFKLTFSDAEGDIDSLLIKNIVPGCPDSEVDLNSEVPADFKDVKATSGDLIVSYGYRVDNYPRVGEPQCRGKNDTCRFRFVLVDLKKNKSDTVFSDQVVILNP